MKSQGIRTSLLWQYCDHFLIGRGRHDLRHFRSRGANSVIAQFDPSSNGPRYLRMLVYSLASTFSEANEQRLRNISNRNLLGEPITVTHNGEAVCLDYLQAVLELAFIDEHMVTNEPLTVLEIGAGYGRTAHAIACNRPLAAYWIIDLPGCLSLSKQYLKQVLPPDLFNRFHFVPVSEIQKIKNHHFDLAVNIDSFAEMSRDTVRCYLDVIDQQCRHLYVKNPVCNNLARPADPTLGVIGRTKRYLGNMLCRRLTNNFLLADEIDIFDESMVRERVPAFVASYCPGATWSCLGQASAPPWIHYRQAMYRKQMK